ncbi:MAG: TIR domain-containing protein [Enhygromyxa sp.]
MQPLLVQVLFHPRSDSARICAKNLYRALNNDPALPGLRVPVLFAPERAGHRPPDCLDFEQSKRNIIIVLADEVLDADDAWCSFIAEQWERCHGLDDAHLLPIQLSEHAWPLEPRLEHTSFSRAWVIDEREARHRWIESRVVLELLRFLTQRDADKPAPIQLFLSHTKLDILSEPRVFRAICGYLDARKPVERWIDSAKIPGGSRFDEEIAAGVQDSALLVILTDNYSSRSWCRREVLLAKSAQRPIVVIDALEDLELRSFPYLGNVPVHRWSSVLGPQQAAARAVGLVIKEVLRQRVTRLWLEPLRTADDFVLVSPPELINLHHISCKRTILYPDPPLAEEERELLEGLPLGADEGLRLETPMQRRARGSLAGKLVALSNSEADDLAAAGMFNDHFDDMLLTVSRELLLRGAKLVYGGHLGKASYTVALFELAQAYRGRAGIPAVEKIINYVGWPLTVHAGQRSRFKGGARFVEVPRPEGVAELDPATFVARPEFFDADSPARRYAWARGMTAMRERQTKDVDARVIIGGAVGPTPGATPEGEPRLRWYKGRIPGVLEEFLLSLEHEQPIYLVGAFGGVGRLLVDLLEGRARAELSWEFQGQAPHAEAMRELYLRRDEWRSYGDLHQQILAAGVAGLNNGLTGAENHELWTSCDIERIAELIITGLSRL